MTRVLQRWLMLVVLLETAGAVLVDFGDLAVQPPDIADGFEQVGLGEHPGLPGGIAVDVNAARGAELTAFHRDAPVEGGGLALAAMLRDGIFVAAVNTANYYRVGVDIPVTGLVPGAAYAIDLWSYDSGAPGERRSDWSVVGLNGPYFGVNDRAFDGSVLPAADDDVRFRMMAYADGQGRLMVRGRPARQSTSRQVFLNGLAVARVGEDVLRPEQVLALDFNDRTGNGGALTQPGFEGFVLGGDEGVLQASATRVYGGLTATLTAVGGSGLMDDRLRTTPANTGAFTDSLLIRDFIFGSNLAAMDCTVSGLVPGGRYLVEAWCFDSSTAQRTTDWTVNGALLWDDYVFAGSNLPVTNDDSRMTGVFTASATGELVVSGRGVAGTGAVVFLNALRISSLAPAPVVDLGRPVISEFVADNSGGITDEDGAHSDWIEIWNTTAAALDLTGWGVSDDPLMPLKWVFPAGVVLAPQARLRVWASGKDRKADPQQLHTNFALSKLAGEALALNGPDGVVVHGYESVPAQRTDAAYGLDVGVDPPLAGYFPVPTPGAPNGEQVSGFVAEPVMDVTRGFYERPFTVHVSCATPDAVIRFTTDGSEPDGSSAVYPESGIAVAGTTVLRARAFLALFAPSGVVTQSYVFNGQVGSQPADPPGWPATWGVDSVVGTVVADYAMDPRVVSQALPGYGVTDALAALPAVSLVLDPGDFHSVGTGIYANPKSTGIGWERAASIEWLNADGSGFQSGMGLRIHGNASRTPNRMQKHSFRCFFRDQYGNGRLNARLFEGNPVTSFDKLVLHCFFTDGWGMASWDAARYRPHNSVYFRDHWLRRSFAAMGYLVPSMRYVHLHINGLYWGVYGVGERVDEEFLADHLGGVRDDWELIADFAGGNTASATAGWNSLFSFINSNSLAVRANYEAVAAQVDLVNFADYYLLHVHADAEDWSHHNGHAYRHRSAGSKWRFMPWDQEIVLDPTTDWDRLSASVSMNNNTDRTPGRLFQKLRLNPEFRLLFADRVHRHLHGSGVLSAGAEKVRWQQLADLLDRPIVAESARWGDAAEFAPWGNAVPAGTVFTRESHWLPSVAEVRDSHFDNIHNPLLSYSTLAELRAPVPVLYPLVDPPVFGLPPGVVVPGALLTMTGAGTVFFTLDGRDPREVETGKPAGVPYGVPVALERSGSVKARVLRNNGEWSALAEATYIVGEAAAAENLLVSELHYHPAGNGESEFIELMNVATVDVDLSGVSFEGFTYVFPEGSWLEPGGRLVLVRNAEAFASAYGNGVRIAGVFVGALDNSGEQVAVIAADGSDISRFRYDDLAPWPVAADGGGRSLTRVLPRDLGEDLAAAWRPSAVAGGTPGGTDAVVFAGDAGEDADGDGLSAMVEFAIGSDPADRADGPPVLSWLGLEDGGVELRVMRNLLAEGLRIEVEASADLVAWRAAGRVAREVAGTRAVEVWRAPGGAVRFFRLRVVGG